MKAILALLFTFALAAAALATPTYQTALSTPITYNVTVGPGQTMPVALSTITLVEVIDRPDDKLVIAYIAELQQPVIVWSKTAYPGDWTHAQLMTRLQGILAGTITDPSS